MRIRNPVSNYANKYAQIVYVQFPLRLMVKMGPGQVVEVESDGKWCLTKVQEVSMFNTQVENRYSPPPRTIVEDEKALITV